MKVLVLGSNGMAGHVITRYLKQQGHDVSTLARNNADYCVDVEDVVNTNTIMKQGLPGFDFVINCIGLLVKDANANPDRAALINSWFPRYLEQLYKDKRTKIIHLSTDCVFDGKKGEYVESDTHTETNPYGRSKSLGEINNDKDITFRMSIIGPELKTNGTGLLGWVVNNPNQELPGWDNAWWNGITTLQLAKCIAKYLDNPVITGVVQLVNNDVKINKYDLLCKINTVYNLNKTILRTQGPKPVNKILINTRTEIDWQIPNYDVQLQELYDYTES